MRIRLALALFAAYHRFFPEQLEPPCLLRIVAGTRTIDPSFYVDLTAVTGGAPTGGIAPRAPDRPPT